ncbi:collagen alpha chain-like isoform X2 [Cebidichthys violaceus]
MDISLLREQYRCTRETQRRHTHVLLLRTVSEELSGVVVSQGFTSPPAVTFDPDPWHVHLELHRRCCPGVTDSSSRRSSSSSESRKLSSCSSFCSSTEEVKADGSRGDPGPGSSDGSGSRGDPGPVSSRGNPDTGCSDGSRGGPGTCSSRGDPGTGSSDGSRGDSGPSSSIGDPGTVSSDGSWSRGDPGPGSCDGSRENPEKTDPVQVSVSGSLGSRKFSAPALRFTRQLSLGGVGSSAGVHQNQNQNQSYHPFPNRKTPRISEAARRLGMYSSF